MTDQQFAHLAALLRPKRAKPIQLPNEQRAWADLDTRYGGIPIEDGDG